MICSPRSSRGFTLLELLLAATLVAAMAVSLYTAMQIAWRARLSVQRQTGPARQAAIALDLVERQLQSVMPPTGILAGAFVGTASGVSGQETDSLDCYVLGSDPDATTSPLGEGIRRIQLGVQQSSLVLRIDRNLTASVRSEPQPLVLVRQVKAFRLRYYDGFGWQGQWDSTQMDNVLPLAVEATLQLAGQDASEAVQATRVVPLSAGRISPSTGLMGGLP